MHDTPTNNQQVVAGFEYELTNYCVTHNGPYDPFTGRCKVGPFNNGLYTNVGNWNSIPGFGSSYPNLNTQWIWMASYVYPNTPVSTINAQEATWTQHGYMMYSWQYTDDSCTISYSGAKSDARQASPAFPYFDRWTNMMAGNGVATVCP